MNDFIEVSIEEIEDVFQRIGKQWMLITVADGEKVNAMTASWGSMGVLWRKNVCTVFIRPQRHTYGLIENTDEFSIAFLPEEYRGALNLCGKLSGRDCDKLCEAGLTSFEYDGVSAICEAELVLVCRKLYSDDLKREKFISEEPLYTYADGDFHRFYICEIKKVLKKK